MISLVLQAPDPGIEPGDAVRVTVAWKGLDRDARAIRVSAQADIVLDGERHEVAGSRASAEVTVSSAAGEDTVELLLPTGSPASYVGRRFSIVWSVNGVVDIAHGRDHHHAGPSFEVAVSGSRVRAALERAAPPSLAGE